MGYFLMAVMFNDKIDARCLMLKPTHVLATFKPVPLQGLRLNALLPLVLAVID